MRPPQARDSWTLVPPPHSKQLSRSFLLFSSIQARRSPRLCTLFPNFPAVVGGALAPALTSLLFG